MFDAIAYSGLMVLLVVAALTWTVSLAKRDVSIVDSLWGPMIALAAAVYWLAEPIVGARADLVLTLVVVWALRLAIYITWRNWGAPEDYRYQEIRHNNEPWFAIKSLYIVFGLQAVLAWIVSLSLFGAIAGVVPLGVLDYLGIALWLLGMIFETVSDWQLARFKARPENAGRVLDYGLWRYTRHPNYFGECCVWWGFYCFAASAGGWWAIVSPLLMTVLLLRVSGVALLERDMPARRPGYALYTRRTSAFLPLPPRKLATHRHLADFEE